MSRVGAEDVAYVRRLNRFSRCMEVVGRLLILLSPEPVTFVLGVGALWVHKQLQSTEIGHTALHGAYDRLPGGEAFASKKFRWDTPIDEESWRHAHNVRHHGNTNVAGKDPDIDFGPVRLTTQTEHAPGHRWQLPFALGGHLSVLRVHHQHARHRPDRGDRTRGAAAPLPARSLAGEPPRGAEEGAAQVRPVLPLQLRPLPGPRRARSSGRCCSATCSPR